jgi:hypothetical protein
MVEVKASASVKPYLCCMLCRAVMPGIPILPGRYGFKEYRLFEEAILAMFGNP